MIKAILFDLEGVLTKEGALIEKKIYPNVNNKISYDELFKRYQQAKTANINFDEFCKGLDKNKVLSFIETDFGRKNIEIVLEELSKNYKLYLASNHIQPMGGYEIDKLGVRKYFTELFFSSELKLAKPKPQYFETILNKINCRGEEVLFIDDAKLNLEGAKSKGIITIWLDNNDNNIRNQINYVPDYTIKKITDVLDIIKELSK